MIRDCKLYSITEIPLNVKTKYPEINNFKLCQNLGSNQNSSYLYALIHFFMNQKMEAQLKKLISIKFQYQSKFQQALANLLKSNNGIKNFFEELYIIDRNGQFGENFLKEICIATGLTSQSGTINTEQLANYFGVQIVLIPGPKYGNSVQKVYLFSDALLTYFLIPSQILAFTKPEIESMPRGQCCRCQKLTREYFTPPICKHHICLTCLEKFIQSNGNYNCPVNPRCQVVLKRTLQQFQAELQYKKEQEIRKLEDSKKQPITEVESSKIIEICLKCHKEQPYRLFKTEGCNHKFCFQCTDSFLRSQSGGQELFCQWGNCCKKFTKSEYQNYLSQLQEKSKGNKLEKTQGLPEKSQGLQQKPQQGPQAQGVQEKSQEIQAFQEKGQQSLSQIILQECSLCRVKINIKDQFVNNCSHSICNKCINNSKSLPLYCPNYFCTQSMNLKELQDYQSNMILCCDGCKTEHLKINLYKNFSCNHFICFDCIKKRMKNEYMHCIDGCLRFLIGEQFQEFFETQQIRQVEESERELKRLDDLKKSKAIEKDESKSSHGTSKSQHLDSIDSTRNSKLIKNHSVQSLNEDSYKNKKDAIADQKQFSAKQLSVIQDEGETDKQQEKQLQNKSNQQDKQQEKQKQTEKQEKQEKQQEKQEQDKQENQPKQNPNDRSSSDIESSQQIQEILLQNIQFQQEDELLKLQEGECTMCFTQFSQYNLKQILDCKKHQIGVCCIRNFKVCPQCEKKPTNNAIRVKEKLMLQTFKTENEDLQESVIITSKYKENNYFDRLPDKYQAQQQSPATEKYYQIQKDNYNILPNYERPSPVYDRPGSRFQSNVVRHASMDPRQIPRYQAPINPYRYNTIRTNY